MHLERLRRAEQGRYEFRRRALKKIRNMMDKFFDFLLLFFLFVNQVCKRRAAVERLHCTHRDTCVRANIERSLWK